MAERLRIAGISGSLRGKSFNSAALRAARELQPDTLDIEIMTLENIEPFNEDVEAKGWPQHVSALRDRVAKVDGILFATPEYNYSVPGVLKNTIDWLSRPTGKGPICGKPVAIIGASQSKIGTARAQAHLRQIAFYNAMPLLPSAEVLISQAQNIFDDDGKLRDEDTRKFMRKMLEDFAAWTMKHAAR